MKKVVNVTEVQGEGLVKLLGENIFLICARYIYAGELIGVNEDCVLLKDAHIVYETGEWSAAKWQDAQALPNKDGHYVMKGFIESFGLSGK